MGSIEVGLTLARPPSADDAYGVFVALGVDDQNDSPIDGPDRDEAIFTVRMRFVEDLKVVIALPE